MAIGISSVYFSKSIRDGRSLAEALLDLGFDGIELEYRIDEEIYRALGPALLSRGVKVFSIHSPMPNPDGGRARTAPQLSALDETERREGLRLALRSLDSAAELGASAVVVHLGRVLHPGSLKTYRRMLAEGDSSAGAALVEYFDSRARYSSRHFDSTLRSLEELNREAARRGLLVGVENRFHLRDIPSFEEVRELMERFKGGVVRYWHDTGHAAYHEKLGVRRQRDWLETFGPALAGMHLHDIRDFEDHLAPGTGELDFSSLAAHVPSRALRIMEVKGSVSREDVLRGRRLLESAGF